MEMIKIKKEIFLKIFYYFILIAFLFPRGYSEYNITYKRLLSTLVWISVILIWINILISIYKKKKITINKKDAISIVTYFFIAILITIIVRNGIFTGLQLLFAYPTICAFIIFEVKGNQKMFLNCMNNIMLILFILNPIMTKAFFELGSHLTFLGHVQLISQLGLLATFSSILYYILFKEKKIKTYCIIFFIEINLLTTDATAAILTAVLLIICFIIYKINFKNILLLNSKIYIFIGIIFNIFVITISVLNNVLNNNLISVLDFSGRSFVWISAIEKIRNSLLFGYGIDGIKLRVFWNQWTATDGFNYAHNQILQNLLDGGMVLFIAFWNMIITFCKNIKNISNEKVKALSNSILIIFLIIMIFESATLYSYLFIFLSIVYILKYNNELNKI